MRKRETKGPISVNAIAGTYVVLLGMDIEKQVAVESGLRGFAIERQDHTENERTFLQNFRSFEGSDDPSSYMNPFQEFVWGDYTAKENHEYTYVITARFGTPGQLKDGPQVSVDIQTENSAADVKLPPEENRVPVQLVYFNRGVAASQAYARTFHNEPPDKVPGGAAFRWLSRGLEEAMLAFIQRAEDSDYSLRACAYEFTYEPVLHEYSNARKRGVDVRIIVDEKENSAKEPRDDNMKAIKLAGIEELVTPREENPSYIAHNKFIVLLYKEEPIAVWTGSTNVSEGGIFGQSNVGHEVWDPKVAEEYLAYWTELSRDPDGKELRPWNDRKSPVPRNPAHISGGTSTIFSPHTSLEALDFYAKCMEEAKSSVFFTAAFGVNKVFKKVLNEKRNYLRYVLLETLLVQEKGSRKRVPDKDIVILMKRDPDDRFAVGAYLQNDVLGKWVRERLSGLNAHVRYIHDKFMLVDPLGADPLVITGSANFSDASTNKNDENMLLIRGNPRVADIYLTEFMRLFHHYDFRDKVMGVASDLRLTNAGTEKKWNRGPSAALDPTDAWWKRFFVVDSPREKERLLFNAKP